MPCGQAHDAGFHERATLVSACLCVPGLGCRIDNMCGHLDSVRMEWHNPTHGLINLLFYAFYCCHANAVIDNELAFPAEQSR